MTLKKGKKESAVSVSTKRATVRKPRQARLAGMEDARLDELHGLSEDYVAVRDQRIALNQQEKPLKDKLLAAMHQHGKTHYSHGGLEITVVHESEKVKVKIHKGDAENESEAA